MMVSRLLYWRSLALRISLLFCNGFVFVLPSLFLQLLKKIQKEHPRNDPEHFESGFAGTAMYLAVNKKYYYSIAPLIMAFLQDITFIQWWKFKVANCELSRFHSVVNSHSKYLIKRSFVEFKKTELM